MHPQTGVPFDGLNQDEVHPLDHQKFLELSLYDSF